MGYIGVILGYIGIMENKMETTIIPKSLQHLVSHTGNPSSPEISSHGIRIFQKSPACTHRPMMASGLGAFYIITGILFLSLASA